MRGLSTLGLSLLAADKATLISFDIPGSGAKPGQGTAPITITDAGAVVGYYVGGEYVGHRFLRALGGRITTIDAPGAGTAAAQGTVPITGNPAGEVAGSEPVPEMGFCRGGKPDRHGAEELGGNPCATLVPAGEKAQAVRGAGFGPHTRLRTCSARLGCAESLQRNVKLGFVGLLALVDQAARHAYLLGKGCLVDLRPDEPIEIIGGHRLSRP